MAVDRRWRSDARTHQGVLWAPEDTAWPAHPAAVRIDPQANRRVQTIAVSGHLIDVATAAGAVWVSVGNPGTPLRIAGR